MYGYRGKRGIRWTTYPEAGDRVQRIFTNEKKLLSPGDRAARLGMNDAFLRILHRGSTSQHAGLTSMKEDHVDQEHRDQYRSKRAHNGGASGQVEQHGEVNSQRGNQRSHRPAES